MSPSLTSLFRSQGPARRVALLPDHLFFTRAVPVAPESEAPAVAEAVALALEALSPFPLAQLYYGHFWQPGSPRALVFAAYRRRFPAEVTDEWTDADLVLPAFAGLLGAVVEAGHALVLHGAESVTVLRWAQSGAVPTEVIVRPVAAEAPRDTLLRDLGITEVTREFTEPPALDAEASTEKEFVIRTGELRATLPVTLSGALDVRDKEDLERFRRAQTRDRILWRTFLACAAALAFALVGEGALAGARFWQNARELKVAAQKPVVEKIMSSQTLATRIDDLSTKRLKPFEMIALVNEARPRTIQFIRTTTSGHYTLVIDGQTESVGDVAVYSAALSALPSCEKVELKGPDTRGRVATFIITVTFKPEALNGDGKSS